MLKEISTIQSTHESGNNQSMLITYRQWPARYRDGKLFVLVYLFIGVFFHLILNFQR